MKIKIITILLVITSFSCSKDENKSNCTDKHAINYNIDAPMSAENANCACCEYDMAVYVYGLDQDIAVTMIIDDVRMTDTINGLYWSLPFHSRGGIPRIEILNVKELQGPLHVDIQFNSGIFCTTQVIDSTFKRDFVGCQLPKFY